MKLTSSLIYKLLPNLPKISHPRAFDSLTLALQWLVEQPKATTWRRTEESPGARRFKTNDGVLAKDTDWLFQKIFRVLKTISWISSEVLPVFDFTNESI